MSNQPCQGAAYELAKRFVGVWQEYTVKGEEEILEGTLEVRLELGGYVLTQRFTSVDGAFSFLSFGYVEPETQRWYETYVFNDGRTFHWRWREAGEEVILDQVEGNGEIRRRLRIVHLREDSYEVVEEKWIESGGWKTGTLTRTRRIG